jgi:polyferredoxin
MKKTELAPLWVRIIVFLLWPVVAVFVLLLTAAILIAVWPLVLIQLTLKDTEEDEDE